MAKKRKAELKEKQEATLGDCRLGQVRTISGISKDCPLKIRRRLCDLGFLSGEQVKVTRKSLLSKVILLEIRGYSLSLQKSIAKFVGVGG